MVMKLLTTLFSGLVTFAAVAQQMPYNPDSNGDDFVGVDDVLGVLGLYDSALIQSDLTCNYEGTEFEQLIGGLIAGDLVLDSIYVEYSLTDSDQVFLPECPDPVWLETVLERGYMLQANSLTTSATDVRVSSYLSYLGYSREIDLRFTPGNGKFTLRFYDVEIQALTSFSNTYYEWDSDTTDVYCSADATLPFLESWTLNEDGMNLSYCPQSWMAQAEHFRVIPFWHEAE